MQGKSVKKICRFCFILVQVFSFMLCNAQNDGDNLYKKRDKILKDIELAAKLLESTSKKKGKNLNRVRLISNKISKRKQLVKSYQEEVIGLNRKIEDRSGSIKKLEGELEKQKQIYSDFIRYSYKNHNHFSVAVYLLASDNLNQFYLRKKYLEQLKEARVKKIRLIEGINLRINKEIKHLDVERKGKTAAIAKLELEQSKLGKEKLNREEAVKLLESEEKTLKRQINEKRKIEEEIAKRLEVLIAEEARKSKYARLTPEQKITSANFESNRGKLPWPTRQGVITEKFGEHFHPVIKGVKVRNGGVDITTVVGESVRSIFSGEITRVFAIKGENYTVIVRHGTYYTVYHNLYDIKVNVGDKVNTKEEIGRVSKAKNGYNAVIHFAIWKGMDKLNPEDWISN